MARVLADLGNPVEINTQSQGLSQSVSQSKSKRKKEAKGTVVVQVFKERLRLVWSYVGKRYYLYIGLPESRVNRTVAEQKARQIELDIASNNFDPSLKKYKPQSATRKKQISAVLLFQQYMEAVHGLQGCRAVSEIARKVQRHANLLEAILQGQAC